MPSASKSLLIVDSERLLVDLFGSALPADEVQVIAAENCKHGWSIIGRIRVDLMLINAAMPDAAALIDEAIHREVEVVRKTDAMSEILDMVQLKLGISPTGWHQRSVLVVDDEVSVANFIREILIAEGYNVRTASNGVEALEKIEKDPDIDVVLLDIIMPQKGGMETLVGIQQRKHHPVVVMMTAVSDAFIAESAIKAGAFDYIAKPLDAVKIISAVDAAAAHHEYTA